MNTENLKKINRKVNLCLEFMNELKNIEFFSMTYDFIGMDLTQVTLTGSDVFYFHFDKDKILSIDKISKGIDEEKKVKIIKTEINIPDWV